MTTDTMAPAETARTGPPRSNGLSPGTGAKVVNLAVQGGGAHGAFAWGVLDRLLEDERIAFEGISATSAGAMNAVVLADGFTKDGREGARAALADFWRRVSDLSLFSPFRPTGIDWLTQNRPVVSSTAYTTFDLMTRVLSPYQFNPFDFNPFRQLLAQSVDFDCLRESSAIKLFLCATNVRTGKIKVFGNDELSVDAVLASACLPFLFQAVEIDGEHYWDGGYMGNPAIFPLIYDCDSRDVVVVQVNPIVRNTVPQTAHEILNRINEISFNSTLMREMRAIAFVSRLIDEGHVTNGALRRMLIHAIETDDFMCDLGVSSKLSVDWAFLTQLREVGREQAGRWLAEHFDRLNVDSTIDIGARFL